MRNTENTSNSKPDWRTDVKLLRRILTFSLALNILTVLFFVGKRVYYDHYNFFNGSPKQVNVPQNDSLVTVIYNKLRFDDAAYRFFKTLPDNTSDIVFLGTSLTAGFPLQEIFKNIRLKNRGIGGNTSKDIIKRLDEVTEGNPEKIFLEVGINDIGTGVSIDTLLTNVKIIAETIKNQAPHTRLYIQSVFPTSLDQKSLLPKIIAYNRKLKDLCVKSNLAYIDLYPVFYKDGGLNRSLTIDGVHLNGKGYYLWMKSIEKYVSE